MPTPNLKSLSVPELLSLRDDIDRHLEERRSELQAQLAQIGGRNGVSARGVKVPPKYRHPATGETWSGRGDVASWLSAELRAGKTREDFLIASPVADSRAKPRAR
jgi:DNA-binding protein H-NS